MKIEESKYLDNGKSFKNKAKQTVISHYFLFVVICLIGSFIGAGINNSLNYLSIGSNFYENTLYIKNNFNEFEKKSKEEMESYKKNTKESDILGRKDGVISGILNHVSSGSLYVSTIKLFQTAFKSPSIAFAFFIFLALLIILAFNIFIVNVYKVISRRLFLEAKMYEKVPIHRFMYALKIKRWMKIAWTMAVKTFYQLLWNFTIVGGLIKHYSYFLVPYIVAENPDINAKDAINLSRDMMRGHKMECFIMQLTFIPWMVLDYFTKNITTILITEPYFLATYCEYYEYLRKIGKKNNIKNIELLNDVYLFKHASTTILKKEYKDVIKTLNTIKPKNINKTFKAKILDFFGIASPNRELEEEYEKEQIKLLGIKKLEDELNKKSYPTRLYTIKENVRLLKINYQNNNYMKHYSITSIILLFFIFSFIGWVWEVLIHLMRDGEFINRGFQHGPWLPIYGVGGTFILLILNKLRTKPLLHFFAIILLCGIIEYSTAFVLESLYGGVRWWYYGGYFLNLHGRICAEGLLFFGIGGFAVTYFVAPAIDNYLYRINVVLKKVICFVLVIIFIIDIIYSHYNPNLGKGITYETQYKEVIK